MNRFKSFKQNKFLMLGYFIVSFFVFVAIFAPYLTKYEPNQMMQPYLKPSFDHFLGTNDVGHDIFTELVYGSRVSLYIGIFTAVIVTFIGTTLAMIAGYFGGLYDKIITFLTNIAIAVPSLPLTALLMAYLEPGKLSLIISISITAWTSTTRILRSMVMQISQMPFIKIEKSMGVPTFVIFVRHILPNIKDVVFTRASIAVASAMMIETGLSFLGLSSFGEKTWGNILHFAFFRNSIMNKQYWWYIPPMVCITLSVFGFMIIGYYGSNYNEKENI